MVTVGSLMFSFGSPVKACGSELKYDKILAVRSRGFGAMASQSSTKMNLQYFQPDRLTVMQFKIMYYCGDLYLG